MNYNTLTQDKYSEIDKQITEQVLSELHGIVTECNCDNCSGKGIVDFYWRNGYIVKSSKTIKCQVCLGTGIKLIQY